MSNEIKLTCIECPMGCDMVATVEDGVVTNVKGNTCPRGRLYAQNEVVCPKRVVTSTVRMKNGDMLPVKTDKPVEKNKIFEVMKKINCVTVSSPVKIGDILIQNIEGDANLVATDNR
ncbi:MAG: DUF1667 domain-containing protein [Clostridia bacterium]|nr:DUF1667 domain-containing protein [Clostridia bacterium]